MSRISGSIATATPARDLHFVTFLLDQWEYGIEVTDVCGIYHDLAIIPTPDEPGISSGEIQLSFGRVPVMDLRRIMHLPDRTAPKWLLVIGSEQDAVGLLVDRVSEVIRLQPRELLPVDAKLPTIPARDYLQASAAYDKRKIHFLDWSRLLSELRR